MTVIKKLLTTNSGEGVEKREHLYTAEGNLNMDIHYGYEYGGSSRKPINRTTIQLSHTTLGYIPERTLSQHMPDT